MAPIPSVNYHLLLACNMSCGHCFAASLSKRGLDLGDSVELVRKLASAGFEKINFAGGEPMLHEGLERLIREAKKGGMATSIVTNGTKISREWLDGVSRHLDWIAISIDSADPEVHRLAGRAVNGRPVSRAGYGNLCLLIRERGIRLKINTVVTRFNHAEDMTEFIRELKPERWKIMQALPVRGQNDRNTEAFEVTCGQFEEFVKRNSPVGGISIVPENNRRMTGSYAMIDPLGRFFDNTGGAYAYSRPILDVGVEAAYREVNTYADRFDERGGRYDWRR